MEYNRTLTAKNLGTRIGSPRFIVLHDTAGSGTVGDAQYLALDPEHRGISVDFCILKDGTVHQLNPDINHKCTYHAGRHTLFQATKESTKYVNGGVNTHSIGIEISQKANMKGQLENYPLAQVRAVAAVCVDMCKTYLIGRDHITTHAKIITDGSRSDPRLFPWEQFWAIYDEMYNQSGTIPISAADIENPGQGFVKVLRGNTLWTIAEQNKITVEHLKALNNMNTPSTVIKEGQTLRVK